jgi:hypothetical protein
MIIKTADSESGHWYKQDGTPAYRIVGKNGNERNTTVRDARSLNLVPSVTTILGLIAKPGLSNWLQQQVLLAALTLPRIEGESEENWLERVMTDSKSTGRDAMDRGTMMHGILERFYRGEQEVYPAYVWNVDAAIKLHFGHDQEWEAERSFAYQGFGGKVDLIGANIVIDFKSKEGSLEKVTPFHEQIMQLAAYRNGLGKPTARCANVYFTAEGNVKLIEHSEDDLAQAWDCFQYLLGFYKRKNNL